MIGLNKSVKLDEFDGTLTKTRKDPSAVVSESITFVIACYNDSNVIEKTINSISVNLRKDDRILVIDGASQDDTLAVLQRIKEVITKLEYISEKDSGIYEAWNKALKDISSCWVCFLGCGDLLRSDFRENVSVAINQNPKSNFIHCVAQMYLWDSNTESNIELRRFGKKFDLHDFKRQMRICHVGALHHYSLFSEFLFSTRYKCVSDYHFMLRKLPDIRPTFINRVLVDVEASGISTNSLFPIKEELIMKKNLGGYSIIHLYSRAVWMSLKYYLFKVYNYRYRFRL